VNVQLDNWLLIR